MTDTTVSYGHTDQPCPACGRPADGRTVALAAEGAGRYCKGCAPDNVKTASDAMAALNRLDAALARSTPAERIVIMRHAIEALGWMARRRAIVDPARTGASES